MNDVSMRIMNVEQIDNRWFEAECECGETVLFERGDDLNVFVFDLPSELTKGEAQRGVIRCHRCAAINRK